MTPHLNEDPEQTLSRLSADFRPTALASGSPNPTTRSTADILSTITDLAHASGEARLFGDYQVTRLIGQGAMGRVYEVLNPIFDPPRREALKVISSKLRATPEAQGRFRAEMALMANLKHPNIVSVYDAGEVNGQLYFTMSLEESGDLEKLVRREGPLPAKRAAEIVQTVARAIEEAHKQHIVHRDLKPSNILLGRDDAPVVTDFGLARLMSPSTEGTIDGEPIMGTPCYMSPEQADGRHSDLGPPSDVYSLGAILYELLTKRPPFIGRDVAHTLQMVRSTPIDRPRTLNPRIPRSIEAICLKCLDRDPKNRYRSAGELAAALEKFVGQGQAPPALMRTRIGIGLTVLVVVALLGLGIGGWNQNAAVLEARNYVALGDRSQDEGRPIQALEYFAIALQRYNSLHGSMWAWLNKSALKLAQAEVRTRRGALLEEERQYEEALAALKAAQRDLEELRSNQLDDPSLLSALAEVYHHLGNHYSDNRYQREEREQGLDFYDKAVRLRHDLCDRYPKNRDHERDLALTYGYMGDALLELDLKDRAKHAYEKAKEVRSQMAAASDASAEIICLHARDFGNLRFYHDWNGEATEAIKAGRERLDFYQRQASRIPGRLPGPYLTERATARIALAELLLDHQGPNLEASALLNEARTEYEALAGDFNGAQLAPFRSEVGWLFVTLGKCLVLKNESDSARKALTTAMESLDQLSGKMSAEDYYRRAEAYALLGKLPDEDRASCLTLAQKDLEEAVKLGFKNIRHLLRDAAFQELQASKADFFRKHIAEPIKKNRPTYQDN